MIKTMPIEKKADHRGFFELLADALPGSFGNIVISTTTPGEVRGNHVHSRNVEYGIVVKGKALLRCEHNGERTDLALDGDNPVLYEIPVGVLHAVKNIGTDEVMIIEYNSLSVQEKMADTTRQVIL